MTLNRYGTCEHGHSWWGCPACNAEMALCETCQRLWPIDELEQVQPDGHFVCPLWTGDASVGDADEHVVRYAG